MTITSPPTIPLITDPSTFAPRSQAWVIWQAEQLYPAMADASLQWALSNSDVSATSNTIDGVGTDKTFTVSSGKGFSSGMFLTIADATAPTVNFIYGQVVSYSGTTLIVTVKSVSGSGTKTSWVINQAPIGGAGFTSNSFSGDQVVASGAAFRTSISTLASSATPDIWTNQSNEISFTGVASVTGFATAPQGGVSVNLNCVSTPSFTAGANMLIDGYTSGQVFTAAANDTVEVLALTTTQFKLKINRHVDFNDIQSVICTQTAGALTLTLNPTVLDIRSATLTDGIPNTVSVSTAVSMTIPSGTTLGSVSTVGSAIVQVLMGNGEIAVVNVTSGVDLSETGLISTNPIGQTCTFTGAIAVTTGILTLSATGTGTFALGQALSGTNIASGTVALTLLTGTLGAAGSTYQTNQFTAAASTTITGKDGYGFYSTTARTNQPYRVVGLVNATNTAGAWGDPTLVQGAGGLALSGITSAKNMSDVTSSRAFATTYYNQNNTERKVRVTGNRISSASGATLTATVGTFTYGTINTTESNGTSFSNTGVPVEFVVPPYGSYSIAQVNNNIASWLEWN